MSAIELTKNLNHQSRLFRRDECVVFYKTKETFGGLSNMSGGYRLRVNDTMVLTSEALYQSCRFPHHPELQGLIIDQPSPMSAKMKSKPHRKEKTRSDWDDVRVDIMRWCLRVKLSWNIGTFGDLLGETEDRMIVEQSRKDPFWGAKVIDENTLEGINILGQLLTELRDMIGDHTEEELRVVDPLPIPDFLFLGEPIRKIERSVY